MAVSIRDLLTTWRDPEHQLDRLVTDDERADDIRSQIALPRDVYREITDASSASGVKLANSHATLERAREVLRRHFLASWSDGQLATTRGFDWPRAIQRLLDTHVADGAGCRSCGDLPVGMTVLEHQAALIHDRLTLAGVLRGQQRPDGARREAGYGRQT